MAAGESDRSAPATSVDESEEWSMFGRRVVVAAGVFGIALFDLCMGAPLLQRVYVTTRYFAMGWLGLLLRGIPNDFVALRWCLFVLGAAAAIALVVLMRRQAQLPRLIGDRLRPWLLVAGASAALIGLFAFFRACGLIDWWITSKQPAIRYFPESVFRHEGLQTPTRLAHIGVAMKSYEKAHGGLPALGPSGEQGRTSIGWGAAIAPHVDQYHGSNWWRERADVDGDDPAHANFAGNRRVLGRNESLSSVSLRDGGANTLLVGEVVAGYRRWDDPRNLRDPARGIRPGPDTFYGPWMKKHGAYFLMADGGVRFLDATIDPAVLDALATPHDSPSSP